LEVQCATYLTELQANLQLAKQEDEAKIVAARHRTEELSHYCDEQVRACEQYIEDRLRRTAEFSTDKARKLEEKVAVIDELSKQRVVMAARQAKDRREKAEAKLAAFLLHLEEFQTQCSERVKVEIATADEKVEMAKQRFEEEVALAEKRQAEAEARRDVARAAHVAVISRSVGSAMEARRRGLDNIAEAIEPEPYSRYSGWDIPCTTSDREEEKALCEKTSEETVPKDNDPLMATNSTAVPESSMASRPTTREIAYRE
jgi:hypothetical protein